MSCANSCLMHYMESLADSLAACPSLQELLEVNSSDEARLKITVGPMQDPDNAEQYNREELENLAAWVQIWPAGGGHSGLRRNDTTDSADITCLLEVQIVKQVKESEVADDLIRNHTWKCFADKAARTIESELWVNALIWLQSFSMPGEPMFLDREAETAQGERLTVWYRLECGYAEG